MKIRYLIPDDTKFQQKKNANEGRMILEIRMRVKDRGKIRKTAIDTLHDVVHLCE